MREGVPISKSIVPKNPFTAVLLSLCERPGGAISLVLDVLRLLRLLELHFLCSRPFWVETVHLLTLPTCVLGEYKIFLVAEVLAMN